MPAVISHSKRRDEIAKVVKRIIAESGMESVTVRNVAREAGFSSTIVGHYFKDKRDLLAFTYGTLRTPGRKFGALRAPEICIGLARWKPYRGR